jgi:MFS family permease
MAQMNMKRVILGGLLAGFVINIGETILNVPLMGQQMEEALKGRNLPPVGGGAIGGFVAGAFVVGVLLVWLYAAIRPRYGAGPKTAIIAGVVLWLLAYVWPSMGSGLMGFMPMKLLLVSTLWGLGEVILAALAGAAVYTEAP